MGVGDRVQAGDAVSRIPNADQVARERLRHDCASRGPQPTFKCAGPCRAHRQIAGSRYVNGARWCSFCTGEKHE